MSITTQEFKTKPNIGKRFRAAFVDYGIMFFITYLLVHYYGEESADGSYSLMGYPFILLILIWSIYIVGVEMFYGATFGNSLQKLKPISIRSEKKELTLGQSLKRHLLDLWDMALFGLLGYLFIKNTKYNQRLGDLWAKTIVIDLTDKEQGFVNSTIENTSTD